MDGLTAARAICAMVASGARPYTPIVVCARAPRFWHAAHRWRELTLPRSTQALTASCSDEERARCAAAGMAELMPKPISVVKLQARCVHALPAARRLRCVRAVC
jgi:CheY-like chemotaxis protein